MAVSYQKLFSILPDKGVTPTEMMREAGFSANILTRLRREQYISLGNIEKICRVLNCGVDEILEFVPDKKKNNNYD